MHDIPELKQSRLQKLIERFKTAPNLILSKLFGESRWDSEDIEWESQYGSRGVTPFGSEDAPAPKTGDLGVARHKAHAAYWHEKIFGPASKLNNLRMPGTRETKMMAQRWLAEEMRKLRYRADRRKEWMIAKMLQSGGFTYMDAKMNKLVVDYGIPTGNTVTLASGVKWNTSGAQILKDISDARLVLQNKGIQIDSAIFPTEVTNVMIQDKSVQTLLMKSAFGSGDLFGPNSIPVLGSLLKIKNMIEYDESFEVRGFITSALTAGAGPHTINVDNPADFEAGQTLYVKSLDRRAPESLTITAVSPTGRTVTASGTLSYSYLPVQDFVYVNKKFLDTDKITFFASQVEGQKIAEFALAPYGNGGRYGVNVDSWEKKDPDGVYVRVQNKGLPVLYFEDAVYTIDVM